MGTTPLSTLTARELIDLLTATEEQIRRLRDGSAAGLSRQPDAGPRSPTAPNRQRAAPPTRPQSQRLHFPSEQGRRTILRGVDEEHPATLFVDTTQHIVDAAAAGGCAASLGK